MPNLTLICDYQKTREVTNMTITIHAQGAERKRLVQTISDWLGVPAKLSLIHISEPTRP